MERPAEQPSPPTRPEDSNAELSLVRPFTLADAAAAGVSRRVVDRMMRQGLVRRVLKSVYVDSSTPDSLELRAAALAKAVPDAAIVCDRTAAWLLGADVLGAAGRDGIPPVDVYRLRGGNRVRRPQCHGGTRTLQVSTDITSIDGIQTTNPLRTALDLGRFLRRYDAIAAMDAMMRVGGFTVADLKAELPRFKGQRGVVQLRSLVPHVNRLAESPAESRVRLILIDAGLPTPQLQWEVVNSAGVVIYRLDLAYPELMLAIEYDGREFHSSDADRAHDAARRARLRAMGWRILVLTADDVYGDRFDLVSKVEAMRRDLTAAG